MEAEGETGIGLSFRLDRDAGVLFARVNPDPNAALIDEAWLDARLAESGYGALRIVPAAKTVLLAHYNSGQRIEDLRIGECVDASLSIAVAIDSMSVSLSIDPAQGGKRVTRDDVLAALEERKVVHGILAEAIDRAVAHGAADAVVIARGTPMDPGADGRFECLVPDVRDRVPRVDESGHTDYRDLGEILVVHPGDRLMLRHHSTEGTAGIDVFGASVPAPAGKDVMYASGLAGVSLAPDNPDLLLAAISGQPVQVKAGMIVEPVYTVEGVSMASGNVRFDGSVKVRGDISAGMTVRATGDIEVTGMVEPSMVEAGGSVSIKGGVVGGVGRKDGADYHVRCGGSFTAGYAQQAKVEAGDSIFIDDMAMQCDLVATNHVCVGDRKRGHIVGGRVQATLSVKGKVLGSPNRVQTQIEIGVDPALHKHAQDLAKARDVREGRLLELSKLLAFAAAQPGKVKPEMVERARATAAALSAEIGSLREEEDAVARKLELASEARVVAEKAMYEGVVVSMGTQRYRVVGEHGGGSIGLTDHGLGLVTDDTQHS